MHTLSAVLVFLFGTATLILHDLRFHPVEATYSSASQHRVSQVTGLASRRSATVLSAALGMRRIRVAESTWNA